MDGECCDLQLLAFSLAAASFSSQTPLFLQAGQMI